ncbi:MAG: ATP-dependent RNA helicase HrpA [Gammaproteobacteria bacterium]
MSRTADEDSTGHATLTAAELQTALEEVSTRDYPRLKKRVAGLARRRRPSPAAVAAVTADVQRSRAWVAARRSVVPGLTFPEELPVSAERARISDAISRHQVTVVCGATGSGKTTQLPKICLALGRGSRGLIGHTQPRRIAARSVAGRIGSEVPAPGLVGWKVRFADRTGPDCQVKLMTDGILLAEIRDDPELRRYDTLIVDEAHERSLNIDFLLGYLHRLLPKRPDLKLIITSATIDPARFAEHFGGAPVIEVGGATYPVEERYRPPEDGEDGDLTQGVLAAVDELAASAPRGDVLVFLPGEREIRECAEALRKHHPADTEILPLYGRQSASEQDRVFQASARRRVVLATNVAETSLTVPGIRHVVDSGLVRISRYSYRSKIQRLQVEPVSRASADQRRGRCGRQAPGVCVRLYSEDDYRERPAFTDPEVRRTNLASVILQMETLGLGHIEDFPFLDPPDTRYVRDGYRLLRELGAVDERERVGPLGRRLARLPVDPRLARMVVAAGEAGCLREVLAIVSALSVQDPRQRPAEAAQEADAAHGRFRQPKSDFMTLVAVWEAYRDQRRHQSTSAQRRWAREHFLSFLRLREWHDVHQQLLGLVKDMGMRPNEAPADYAAIHRAVLTGLLSHVGQRDERGEYSGARGVRFRPFPDSTLAGGPAPWVVAAHLVETRRVWGRILAAVEPTWIEQAGAHLLKRSWSDPHWQPERGFVAAREQVSLYGLILAANRRVDFGRVDPKAARDVFIRDALVPGRIRTRGRFLARNRSLVARVEQLEARLRRRELFAGEQAVAAFYARRVPDGVCSARAFETWRRKAENAQPALLEMAMEDVVTGAALPGGSDYPDTLEVAGNRLPLTYRFDPAADDDGVTLRLPRHLLPLVDERRLQWLVPGWVGEKVTAMLRALPKAARRQIVPVPEHARKCLEALEFGAGSLHAGLAEALRRTSGLQVAPETWDGLELEPWMSFRIELIDDNGEVLRASRDLAELRRCFGSAGGAVETPGDGGWSGTGLRSWTFGRVPERVEVSRAGITQVLFPAVRDDGNSVSLRLYPTSVDADAVTRGGVRRLFALALDQQYRALVKAARKDKALTLRGRDLAAGGDLAGDLALAAFGQVFLPEGQSLPRDERAFRARLEAGRSELVPAGEALLALSGEILELRARVLDRLERGLTGPGAAAAAADIAAQVGGLFPAGFVVSTPAVHLAGYPRYLLAALTRMDQLGTREKVSAARLENQWDRFRALRAGLAAAD